MQQQQNGITIPPASPLSSDWYAGIDIGGTKTLIVLARRDGQIAARSKRPTVQTAEPADFVAWLFAVLDEVLQEQGLTRQQLGGIGIGLPGAVNPEEGTIRHVPALPLDGVNLKQLIALHYDGALYLDNDVNVAALGERWLGAGAGRRHLVMVTVGTGIGGAVIINGQLYHGADYTAGEISYFVVDHQAGGIDVQQASSTEFGRFESLASGTGIGEHARRWLREDGLSLQKNDAILQAANGQVEQVQAVHVLELAAAGDAEAAAIMNLPLDYMAAGLANIISLLNPQCIVVGGGVSESAYYMAELQRRTQSLVPIDCPIVPAQLGNEAGALGAVYGVMTARALENI
ncbi:ROK family protein [Paenibacillus kandeliae]|uniref:ROK family protein n=1 Tax=Paenibacillus kandeliae TaxID=3231269 RepID=UPI00345A27FE